MAAMGDDEELSDLKARLKDMVDGGLPVTRERITAVAECGVRNVTKYKKVVYMIERFIRHADDRFRSAGICVIDALCTKSRKTLGKEKDVYTPRFAVRMKETVATLQGIPRADKALLDRIFNEWRKRGWFNVAPLSDPSSSSSAKGASSSSSSAHAHRPSTVVHKRTAPEPSSAQGGSGAAELKRELSTASTGSTGRPEDPRRRSTPKDPRKRSRTSSTGSNGGDNVSSPIVAPVEELVRTSSLASSYEGSMGGYQGGGGGSGGGGQLTGGSGGVDSGHVHTSEKEPVRDPRSSRSRRHSDTDRPTATVTHSHTATLTSSHTYNAHDTRAHGNDITHTRTRETYTHKQETHTDAHRQEQGRAHTHIRVSSSSSSAVPVVSGGGHASSQGAAVGGMHSPDRRSFGGILLSDLEDDEEEEDEPLEAMDTGLPSITTTPTHALTPLTPQLQQQPPTQIPSGTPRQQPQQQITHAAMAAVALAQAPVDDSPAPPLWSTPDDKALQRAKELMALVRDGVNNGNTSQYWPVDDPLYSPASAADVVMMKRDIAMDGTEAHPHRLLMDMDVVGPPLTVVTGPSGFFVSHRQVRMENPATTTSKPPSSTPLSPVVKKPVMSRWGKSVGLGGGGTGSGIR